MILIKPSFKFEEFDGVAICRSIEKYGRVCYKSEDKIDGLTYIPFIQRIIKLGHESVLEHEKLTCTVVCDRGVSHEIVRHRIASYSQESTRYCNYKGGVTFIIPPWVALDEGQYNRMYIPFQVEHYARIWFRSMLYAEFAYKAMLIDGLTPQQARSILPNSLKTEIVMTMNLREWRHFLKLRTSKQAHPQMREITIPMLEYLKVKLPFIFEDINIQENDNARQKSKALEEDCR
jgi:thymidylate synthase (FAD)